MRQPWLVFKAVSRAEQFRAAYFIITEDIQNSNYRKMCPLPRTNKFCYDSD